MVQATFWEEDVSTILAVPVHQDMEDVLAWHFDSKGSFSVKSAYRVLCGNQQRSSRYDQAASSSSGTSGDEAFWSKLWNVEGLGRLRHFMWRLAHNSLALCTNLVRRGMQVDNHCFLCGPGSGRRWHGHFFKCKHVKRVWRLVGLEEVRESLSGCRDVKSIKHGATGPGTERRDPTKNCFPPK